MATAKISPYDGSVEIQPEVAAYDGSAVKIPKRLKIRKRTSRVTTLRSERGYSATKYDASAGKVPKTLRCQIGRFYDVKKVRNNYDTSAVKILQPPDNPKMNQPGHNLPPSSSAAAWLGRDKRLRRDKYDASVAIRPQNTMPVREKSQKSYDAKSVIFTMSKKCVTLTIE